VRDCYWY